MRIACPSCEESYRIEPARLPSGRVRTACLACGVGLYLRRARATNGPAPAGASVPDQEVPLWQEPRPAGPEPRSLAELAAEPGSASATAAAEAPSALPEVPAAAPYVAPAAGYVPPAAPSFAEDPALEASAGAPAPPARRPAPFSFSHVGDVSARAQRLARALVSDILVYQPRKVEQGIRDGNLRDLLREEVEKSWDEYCERLGPETARANRAQFVAALNEVLARGNPVF